MEWIKDLKYVLMPSGHAVKNHEKEYEKAYSCWQQAWTKYRDEVGVKDPLYSDPFIIPDETGALFYQGECVGFACFTYGSLKEGPIKDHSYFKGWTDLALQKLKNISPDVVLCSQFTVNPKFTGKGHIVRWKEIVSLFTLMRFQHSQATVMAGQLNLERKMDQAGGDSFGATVLERCLPYYYGEDLHVQLVAYEKPKIAQMFKDKEIEKLCHELWSKLEHVSDWPVVELEKQIKKAA